MIDKHIKNAWDWKAEYEAVEDKGGEWDLADFVAILRCIYPGRRENGKLFCFAA
jgi:hypothetical protein